MFSKPKSQIFVFIIAVYLVIAIFAYIYKNRILYSIKRAIFEQKIEQVMDDMSFQVPDQLELSPNPEQANASASQANLEKSQKEQKNPLLNHYKTSTSTQLDFLDLLAQWEEIHPKDKLKIQQPCSEQAKIISFKNKVNEHLSACCRIGIKKTSDFTKKAFISHAPAQFFLEIDKAGNISQLVLTGSSGSPVVDEFTIESIKSAVPFPYIPDHLGINKFQIAN